VSNGQPQPRIIVPLASPDPATTDWVPLGPPGPGIPPAGSTNQALVKNSGTDYDVKWGAAGADLIYDGDYASGPTYKDGEIVVYQGIAYICTMPTTSPPSAWPGGGAVAQPPATVTSYGITLPTGPYDGQEAVLVDSITGSNWQWRFRYNAGRTSDTNKWEFVGGAPAVYGPSGSLSTNSTTAAAVPSGPAFTAPRNGSYQILVTIEFGNAGVASGGYTAYGRLMSSVSGQVGDYGMAISTAAWSSACKTMLLGKTMTAGETLTWQGLLNNTVQTTIGPIGMTVTPWRVA